MTKIGLISDTHGFLDEAVFEHFKDCNEIWHAGDIGSVEIIEKLAAFKPTRFVFGNIDEKEIQWEVPENQNFTIEGFDVWITHIGGSPPNYNPAIKKQFKIKTPDIFVCGHSHILKAMRDIKQNNMIYLNPGAAGKQGWHKMKTLLRFTLDSGVPPSGVPPSGVPPSGVPPSGISLSEVPPQKKMSNLEVIELGLRGK